MRRHLRTVAVVVALALVASSGLRAQGQADADAKAKADTALKEAQQQAAEARKRAEESARLVPLSIDIVVSRYQGEKKTSSLPYSLAVNANDTAPPGAGVCQLRMGAQVPVPTSVIGKDGASSQSFTYRDIGTNIDCSARTADDGAFQLRLNIEDTSVYTNVQDIPNVGQMPVFRTFRSTNTLVLRDGQSREFTAAADRVNGEVIRIAVTLKVAR